MQFGKIIQLSLAGTIVFAACTQAGSNSGTASGTTTQASDSKVWKKEVARMIDMREKEDTVVHHLRDANEDTSLIVLLMNGIKSGKITAYSAFDHSFTTKFTAADLDNSITPKPDTILITDPVTGDEITRVVKRDFDPEMIHKYRILEDWTFDPESGKTQIQIKGIAPIKEIYGEDGMFRGIQAMFWVKYEDVSGMLAKIQQYHPNHNLNSLLWDDYFLSDVKPAAAK